jgi:hypothetical protein
MGHLATKLTALPLRAFSAVIIVLEDPHPLATGKYANMKIPL